MLYKVLVVEDETPIRNNLVQKLHHLQLPLTVMDAADGEEALEVIARERPHIVLTDIRMPIMDGLALCSQLDRQYPQIKKVILSGYGEFEYAQKAIQYRVADYLLKPVNQEQLATTMQELCEALQAEDGAEEQRLLARYLAGGSCEQPLLPQLATKRFGIYLLCLGALIERASTEVDLSFFDALWNQADLDGFCTRRFGTQQGWWSFGEKVPNQRILVTTDFTQEFEVELHRYLCDRLSEYVCTNVYGGEQSVSFQEIWKTAQQLRHLLHNSLVPCTSRAWVSSAMPSFCEARAEEELQLVLRAIGSRQAGSFRTALANYLDTLQTQQASQRILENGTLLLIKRMAEAAGRESAESNRLCEHIFALIAVQKNSATLYQMLHEQLCRVFTELLPVCDSGEELARMVRDYLEENYREEISIDTLSVVFHFSASYIGRVFRMQYQLPPVKYLSNLRIERAKELICANSEINLALIAEMVGFSDAHYFSRIFRATVGISPSEYKRKTLPGTSSAEMGAKA